MGDVTIHTERFGDLEIAAEKIIDLPDGLLGFVTIERAVLLPIDDDGLFFWLQAVDHPELAFLVLTPWPLFGDYQLDITEADMSALDLSEADEALVFCLLTSHDEPRRFTANLLGPIIVNQRRRLGRQVVLNGDLPTQAELPALEGAG
jgi:flagellar assembly factor FliW